MQAQSLSKLDKLFRLRAASIYNPRAGLICSTCAGPGAEEKTLGIPGLLMCERCGVFGRQEPGWTHRIGLFVPKEESHAETP